ncbi:MAG: FMN-binding negative transcriptional regulator [Kiloniellales bacterium]
MYVPEAFALKDEAYVRDVMDRYGFALLVTAADGATRASHLPFLFDSERGPQGTLTAHMARANPQWRDLELLSAKGGEALVIFQGPHAYVSPNWYAGSQAVPTWNYVAVHAYGTPGLIEDSVRVRALLERLTERHEQCSPKPWSLAGQEEKYTSAMIRGVVAFEIPVARLEAKAKLNQNKGPEDRAGVIAGLRAADDPLAAEVAALMDGGLGAGGAGGAG